MRFPNTVISLEQRCKIFVEALSELGCSVCFDVAPVFKRLKKIKTLEETYKYIYGELIPDLTQLPF